jgi:hypothetical protein
MCRRVGVSASRRGAHRKILTPSEQLIAPYSEFRLFEVFALFVVCNHIFKQKRLCTEDREDRKDWREEKTCRRGADTERGISKPQITQISQKKSRIVGRQVCRILCRSRILSLFALFVYLRLKIRLLPLWFL